MCGLIAYYKASNGTLAPRLIEDMNHAMEHRGPDDYGFCFAGGPSTVVWRDDTPNELSGPGVAMGHRRLSVTGRALMRAAGMNANPARTVHPATTGRGRGLPVAHRTNDAPWAVPTRQSPTVPLAAFDITRPSALAPASRTMNWLKNAAPIRLLALGMVNLNDAPDAPVVMAIDRSTLTYWTQPVMPKRSSLIQ